jgi:hypothetical protein
MLESVEATPSRAPSHQDEIAHRNVQVKQQSNRMLYADMITKMNCMMNKLNKFTGSVMTSPIMAQNSEAKVEEHETGRLSTLKTDTFSEPTLPITSHLTEHEVKYLANASSAFPVNSAKRLILTPPSTEAPLFHGKHSESPAQFLIHVQEYAKSGHLCDRLTLLNGISQFLRESALEWYCQLRFSPSRPTTWFEFKNAFLAQFNSPVRKARQKQEWHECKQKEKETINEFLVRLRALWREQKPKETESDLVKHLFCRMRNDLLNMLGIRRDASLEEVICEVQQIEEILYRRAKGERLAKQVKAAHKFTDVYLNKNVITHIKNDSTLQHNDISELRE